MQEADKEKTYQRVLESLRHLCDGETDQVALMATIVCELHHAFDYYHWTGFYRTVEPHMLAIGPYQGTHGCLRIAFSDGVCGAAARTQQTQVVPDVHQFPGHIACSATTQSEIVIPVVRDGETIAVFDVDSNDPAAFSDLDARYVEQILEYIP